MPPPSVDQPGVRRALEAEQKELRSHLAAITKVPSDQVAAVSFGKRVGDGTTQAVERIAQVDAARRLAAKLADVQRALAKLADGTYGRCDGCGRPIADERLEAIPWAVLCLDCARERPER